MKEKARRLGDIISRVNAEILRHQEPSGEDGTVQEEPVPIHIPPDENCTHHWKIETPAGETSMGTCGLCGGAREFSNFLVVSEKYRYKDKSEIPNKNVTRLLLRRGGSDIDDYVDEDTFD